MLEEFGDRIQCEPNSGCWIWEGARTKAGYGAFNRGGAVRLAHRESYRRAAGGIPLGAFICHRCDNPPCCNPDHLFAGTCADNNRDMARKGRSKGIHAGEKGPGAKLTENDVRAIRLKAGATSQRQLAREFGISCMTVWNIIHRNKWAHVDA